MEEIKITDNGEVDVQIAPYGEFNGSDRNGNAIPETLTPEGLAQLAETLNASGDSILVDKDHASCRVGLDRNTQAAGWISKFWTTVKGLFGRMKLTKSGRELVENREYRFLSPTFSLDEEGRPVKLHSVALTNTPAFQGAINPIVNHQATQTEKIKMELTKEELVSLIKETVVAMNAEPQKQEVENAEPEKKEEVVANACSVEEAKAEEPKAEEPEKSEPKEEEKPVENTCVENTCEEKTEEVKAEAPTEEPKAEEPTTVEEKEEQEVIKLEALNSAPTALKDVSGKDDWGNLHGQAFFDYLAKHPELTR